jgi:hypothetical protein
MARAGLAVIIESGIESGIVVAAGAAGERDASRKTGPNPHESEEVCREGTEAGAATKISRAGSC